MLPQWAPRGLGYGERGKFGGAHGSCQHPAKKGTQRKQLGSPFPG